MRLFAALALGVAAAASPGEAQETGTFLLRENGETVAAERFTRTTGRLVVERSAVDGARTRWEADLTADGRVSRLRLELTQAGDTAAAARVVTTRFAGDSAVIEELLGDSVVTRRVAAPAGSLPWPEGSIALAEQALRHALALGGGELRVPVLRLPGTTSDTAAVLLSADSATIETATDTLRLRADEIGSVLGGVLVSEGVEIVRWAGHVDPFFAARPTTPCDTVCRTERQP